MISGWLNVNKPIGIKSTSVVAKIKHLINCKKIGHCGTLDPLAEGVLVLALGQTTKLAGKIINDTKKEYKFTIQFGKMTSTGDLEGEIIETTDIAPDEQKAYSVCQQFIGLISQIPPIFSAIKIKGKPAYYWARSNISVELKARPITIFSMECIGYDAINKQATYITTCSKGTYIRSLAQDMAKSMGSLGYTSNITRLKVGNFALKDSINFEINNLQASYFLDNLIINLSLGI